MTIMMTSGIYRIDGPNGKVYIGSSVDIKDRWRIHRRDLRSNQHHSPHLQRAYNKYGLDAFKFSIVEIIEDTSKLLHYEQIWLDILFTSLDEDEIYNVSRVAGNGTRGTTLSEEHRRKISESQVGRTHSEETKRKMSDAAKGRPNAYKGIPISEDHKRKISESKKGHTVSEETRRKISEARRRSFNINQ